ncbi:hypothetical protein HBH56_221790 [Parastagonospora nodorum]|uniref:Uncharacterized protein n=1 Tax=Phaeosphaeria nodorum (strain SN15 / ATCC MYA-4574 / FGSC 10173) TaxID=321614 RepID=A0A7U2F604_PHANO|nr:hypothetical protein HBH56_221790 [Parastagonospora nodorum]QRC97189.1 hypothetical protein JI435_434700 [Parastagonospora nodorum SN15]KAH3924023.1 hypothetical protein HBH54_199960 [Parastagonospora nodorum]KAH3964844.1 hypothetical protein HBH52_209400 [Parastagonospora nodorum]KAH4104828.1 hypothetical protein HBH46_092700 [Parastagonospora nodorum]
MSSSHSQFSTSQRTFAISHFTSLRFFFHRLEEEQKRHARFASVFRNWAKGDVGQLAHRQRRREEKKTYEKNTKVFESQSAT